MFPKEYKRSLREKATSKTVLRHIKRLKRGFFTSPLVSTNTSNTWMARKSSGFSLS